MEDTTLAQVLSEQQIDLLMAGASVATPSGQAIALCFHLSCKTHRNSAVILALWACEDTIAELESQPQCKAMVVVPWLPDDIKNWKSQQSPIVFGRDN
ncbi:MULTISPECIES: hypothetical protein [unclassified Duganella]|uniref:hypothetical protein n=1 Tax=unclassified Duganella TaxID=2636909 RepID=UPI0011C1C9B7|nr:MULTISPECIES: hypothetical protein [unclassified Duganella]